MMQTFFFDTEINGHCSIDDEGVALPDVRSAKQEALVALYGLASEVETDGDVIRAILRVRNAAREIVLALDMNLTVSAPSAVAG